MRDLLRAAIGGWEETGFSFNRSTTASNCALGSLRTQSED